MKNQHIRLIGHGGLEQLVPSLGDVPTPGRGELLVRVEFAGVAFADLMMRQGKFRGAPRPPLVPGYDVVGIVQGVGPGVSFEVGKRVAVLTGVGGYAQYVVVDAKGVAIVPDRISSEKAVCMVLNYLTAYQMLTRTAQVHQGDTVLVHSAAGGVGTAALQLGRSMGLNLFGTASAAKLDLVRDLGATPIDYQTTDFVSAVKRQVPEGLSVALDPIGPANWSRSKQCLRKGGMLVGYGLLEAHHRDSDRFDEIGLAFLTSVLRHRLFSRGTRFAFFGDSLRNPERTREDLGAIFELCVQGRIDPIISDILPLNAAGEAHRRLAAGHVRGKLVLDCR